MPTTSHPIYHCHPCLRSQIPYNGPRTGSTPFSGFSSQLANIQSPFPDYAALHVLGLPPSPTPTPASLSLPRLPRPLWPPCSSSRRPNAWHLLSSLQQMPFPNTPSFLSGHCSDINSLERTPRMALAGTVPQHPLILILLFLCSAYPCVTHRLTDSLLSPQLRSQVLQG